MKNQKWLLAVICAASLIGGIATSLRILDDGVDLAKGSQLAVTATKSKAGWSEADLGIEPYSIKH